MEHWNQVKTMLKDAQIKLIDRKEHASHQRKKKKSMEIEVYSSLKHEKNV